MPHLSKILYFRIYLLPLIILLAACSSSKNLPDTGNLPVSGNIQYSITYIIHGDANYLYHNSEGVARQADGKVLKEAKLVGRKAKNGEVFIFHQRPERKVIWLFPKKDRRFFLYREGKLIQETSYSPADGSGVFSTESQLYHKYKTGNRSAEKSIFLYFGHEIPYKSGGGYFKSVPGLSMNTETFSAGLKKMLADSDVPLDLTVLSTCNNGSPDMVNALQGHTRHLLASPQNLHLSHIDTKPLLVLGQKPEISTQELASELAQSTYLRLKNSIQTVISMSIYDMERVGSYIGKVDSVYSTYLENESVSKPGTDNVDCKEMSVFDAGFDFSNGIDTWYRPPGFGRKAGVKTHSGWGCKE